MAKRHGQEVVVDAFKSYIGDKYDYSKVDYQGNHEKVIIVCPEHGEFRKTPAVLKKGYGCNKCSKAKQLSIDEVIRRFKLKHGNRFDYSRVDYTHHYVKVEIICRLHGSFYREPQLHWSGLEGCPKCDESLKRDVTYRHTYKQKDYNLKFSYRKQEICNIHKRYRMVFGKSRELLCRECNSVDWIQKLKEIHGGKFEYVKTKEVYKITDKIEVVCPSHGSFVVRIVNHSKTKNGCRGCSTDLRKSNTAKEIVSRFDEVHGSKYSYDNFVYLDMHTKGIINCVKHGDFKMTPANHLSDHGCPSCWQNTSSKAEMKWIDMFDSLSDWIKVNQTKIDGVSGAVDSVYKVPNLTKNVVIEYDGNYWHSRDKSYLNDFKKSEALDRLGYHVVRLRVRGQRVLPIIESAHLNIEVSELPDEKTVLQIIGDIERLESNEG